MALDTSGNRKKNSSENDIYTALLGLAVAVLAATTGFVCYQAWQMYGTVFGMTGS